MVRVMVVDDAMFMRKMLTDILETSGHTVVCDASNGEEALNQYKTFKPELVTMDITMPVMNGIEAVIEIKKEDPNAIIFMCSAMGQQGMVIDAIQAGAKDFIVKPFNRERINEAINKVFK